MPSSYTANYQLNQWKKTDRVLMEDFNADNAKIDAAIKAVNNKADGKADTSALSSLRSTVSTLQTTVARKQDAESALKIAAGSYTGDGAASRVIPLGFTPKAVLLINQNGYTFNSSEYHGGLAVPGHPVATRYYTILTIVDGGFEVYCKTGTYGTVFTNASGMVMHYLALG